MGWEERDWAAWSDEERARHLTPGPPARDSYRPSGAFIVAMLVSLVAFGGLVTGPDWLPAPSTPQAGPPPIVYGSGLAGPGRRWTCTAFGTGPDGPGTCTEWTVLLPGQREVEATRLPAGTPCSRAVVDQPNGRWICLGTGSET